MARHEQCDPVPILLERQQRRRATHPIVSVLCASPSVALDVWCEWAGARRVAICSGGAHVALVAELLAATGMPELRRRAAGWLARAANVDVNGFADRFDRKSAAERALFADGLVSGGAVPEHVSAALAVMDGRRAVVGTETWSALVAVCGAVAFGAPFVIAAAASDPEPVARAVERLAHDAPGLPIALCAPPGGPLHDRIMAADSRAMALLREGAIAIPNAARDEPVRTRARAQPDDGARSAAERFLFARLESLRETAGEFELNGRVDAVFGAAPAQIDLLARRLGVAIEIDGYHHFTDADAYRRDRRKDVLMQRLGLFVVRVLADDVVDGVDDVLDTILAVVRRRRANGGRTTETVA